MALYPYYPQMQYLASLGGQSQPLSQGPSIGEAYLQAAPTASVPQQPQQPDMIGQFLQRIMSALEQPEPSAEELVPPARSPWQAFAQNIHNAYAWQPEEQRQQRDQQLWEQQQAAMQQQRERPAKVAQAAAGQRDRNLQRLTQGLNAATLMEQRQQLNEYRQAQIKKLGQPQSSITRGNVRTDIGVYDPSSPTGVSDIDYQLVPQPDGTVRTVEIARRPQQVRTQGGFGAMNGQPGFYQRNPVTGEFGFNTSLTQPAPVGAVQAAVNNVEAKQALDSLVGAYNQARQDFGIEYANPSMLARVRAKISQGLSRREWLRDLEGAGISGPKFLQFDAARKRALNSYVKAQTGAQFSIRELERYEAQFPLPWDDPDTARAMLEALARAAVGKMKSLITQYGGLQSMMAVGPPEIDVQGSQAPTPSTDWRSLVRP